MLYWIYIYVVLPSVHTVQDIYQKYHSQIYTAEKQYDADSWHAWPEGNKEALCGIAFASYWFMFAILCLWCYTMLVEVRKTQRLMKDIKAVEDCKPELGEGLKDMIDNSTGTPRIVKLTKGIDW